MSITAKSDLFWGFCWDQEDSRLNRFLDIEWTDVIAKKREIVDPWDDFPEEELKGKSYRGKEAITNKWMKAHKEELQNFRVSINEIKEEFGCDLDFHGWEQSWRPYVYIVESRKTSWQSHPAQVELPREKRSWSLKVVRFCQELEIERPSTKLGWWLVSTYSH